MVESTIQPRLNHCKSRDDLFESRSKDYENLRIVLPANDGAAPETQRVGRTARNVEHKPFSSVQQYSKILQLTARYQGFRPKMNQKVISQILE